MFEIKSRSSGTLHLWGSQTPSTTKVGVTMGTSQDMWYVDNSGAEWSTTRRAADGLNCAYEAINTDTQGNIVTHGEYQKRLQTHTPPLMLLKSARKSKGYWAKTLGGLSKCGPRHLPFPAGFMRLVLLFALSDIDAGPHAIVMPVRHNIKEWRVKAIINQLLREQSAPLRLTRVQPYGRTSVHIHLTTPGIEELVNDATETVFHDMHIPHEVAMTIRYMLLRGSGLMPKLAQITNLELRTKGMLALTAKRDRHSPRAVFSLSYADWSDYSTPAPLTRQSLRDQLIFSGIDHGREVKPGANQK